MKQQKFHVRETDKSLRDCFYIQVRFFYISFQVDLVTSNPAKSAHADRKLGSASYYTNCTLMCEFKTFLHIICIYSSSFLPDFNFLKPSIRVSVSHVCNRLIVQPRPQMATNLNLWAYMLHTLRLLCATISRLYSVKSWN